MAEELINTRLQIDLSEIIRTQVCKEDSFCLKLFKLLTLSRVRISLIDALLANELVMNSIGRHTKKACF